MKRVVKVIRRADADRIAADLQRQGVFAVTRSVEDGKHIVTAVQTRTDKRDRFHPAVRFRPENA